MGGWGGQVGLIDMGGGHFHSPIINNYLVVLFVKF